MDTKKTVDAMQRTEKTLTFVGITAAVLGLFALRFFDKSAAELISTLHVRHSTPLHYLARALAPGLHIIGSCILAAGLLCIKRWPGAIALYALMQTTSGLFVQLGKHLFGRSRPFCSPDFCAWHTAPLSSLDTFHSLPSGHAAVLGTAAAFLCRRYPKSAPIVLPLAPLLASLRAFALHHFISDVFFGFSLGILSGCLLYNLWTKKIEQGQTCSIFNTSNWIAKRRN